MRRAFGVTLVACGMAYAQGAKQPVNPPAEVKGPVRLQQVDNLHRDLAAFPRLLPSGSVSPTIADKVNASLRKLDVSAAAAGLDCRKSFRESQHKSNDTAWGRTVEVTMQGPRYLSLLATDDFDCGGMYPNDGILFPLVYDLTTGTPVNWLKYLPKGASSVLSNSADGAKMGVVSWPVLTAMGRKQADGDCKDAFDDSSEPVQFALWLDARQGAIEAQPSSFPHAEQACADTVEIDVAEARKLGIGAELVDALEAATKLQQ